jgi:hypothetical protein
MTLMELIPPLLETTLSLLDRIYPHYHQCLSHPSIPGHLKRYLSDLFGILQIVLRAPSFSSQDKRDLDQHLFLQCAKFAQVSDETVHQWHHDPMSIIDESSDLSDATLVRTAVLNCAEEVPSPPAAPLVSNVSISAP